MCRQAVPQTLALPLNQLPAPSLRGLVQRTLLLQPAHIHQVPYVTIQRSLGNPIPEESECVKIVETELEDRAINRIHELFSFILSDLSIG